MKNIKTPLVILLVLSISLFVRLYGLGNNPSILNRDEAAIAYNAFLLQQTGTDEWGQWWPLSLKSFGDYKLLGYPAVVAALYSLFEPSDFIVRLPSALAGVGVLYLLLRLLERFTTYKHVTLYFLLFIACTPIFFFYSRIAFEANLGLCFFLLFIHFILRPLDSKTLFFDFAAVAVIILAICTYNTPLLLLPFIVVLIPLLRGFRDVKKWAIPVLLLLFVGLFFFLTFSALTKQKQGITLFSDPTTYYNYTQYRAAVSGWEEQVLGNKYYYYLTLLIPRFIQSFSPEFLVARGGSHPWHQLPGWGHLLITQYLVIIASILFAITKLAQKLKVFSLKKFTDGISTPLLETETGRILCLLYLIIIGLAPSVVTVDSPHATRSLFFIAMLLLMAGYFLQQFTYKLLLPKVFIGLVFISTSFFAYFYVRDYFFLYPDLQKVVLRSEFRQVLEDVAARYPQEKIAIVDQGGYDYITTAWYLKVAPDEFYRTIKMQNSDAIGFHYGLQVANFTFIKTVAERSKDTEVVVEWNTYRNTWEVQ